MNRRISILVLLSIVLHLGFTFSPTLSTDVSAEEFEEAEQNEFVNTTVAIVEPIVNDPVEDEEEVSSAATTTTTTATTAITTSTTIVVEESPKKQFLTEHFLNVNLSSLSLSELTFRTSLHQWIVLVIGEHRIVLIKKLDGTIEKQWNEAHLVPIEKSPDVLVVFDDQTGELWIADSIEQRSATVAFKVKRISIASSNKDLWLAETSDQLYLSSDAGREWKKINDSSSSVVLGWSNKANAFVVNQHARYIKLLDVNTLQLTSILNDVVSSQLFSQYLVVKQSTSNDNVKISHVNNLADDGFRSLPQRFESQGNFYCAVEDSNTQDLLLLFRTESQLGENNETIPSTCNLISYSRNERFNLTNIDCSAITDETQPESVECSKEQIPIYQIRGLSKRVFLANLAAGAPTMISLDGGVTWNKTHYECDETQDCPQNVSLVIDSLMSSNEAPGIIIGKAFNGAQRYAVVSSNGGRTWRLTPQTDGSQLAISNPNALLVSMPVTGALSMNDTYQYSTDYGHRWHQGTFFNDTSLHILSFTADRNNSFYLLASREENSYQLIELDFNLLIVDRCARHQMKEWTLHDSCVNGSKLFYKRRSAGAHCLDQESKVRSEPCSCTLADFECSPGYKRSKTGVCVPRPHAIYGQDCSCSANQTLTSKSRGYVKSSASQCLDGVEALLSDVYVLRRESNQPNFFLYGNDVRTNRSVIEINTNGFDNYDEDDEEDEHLIRNTIWSIDQSYEVTAIAFDEHHKQIYMAVEHDQSTIIYRISKNLREQTRSSKQLLFDANNELYKSNDEQIEFITLDWLAQNLYMLIRNKRTSQQSVVLMDLRTRKRRTIVKNQQIQPAVLLVDPVKGSLYWINQQTPSLLNVANLQGQVKKQVRLTSTDSNISYLSYNAITHEIIFVINSTIFGFNTLNLNPGTSRVIYEHSSNIRNPLFIHPVLYFTVDQPETETSGLSLHAIDVVAKSFAKNIVRFKDFHSLKLFSDMTPTMPTSNTVNRCASNPCSDICISLENGQFRCLCGDDARYQSCSCPVEERFVSNACQAKNGQCAPGRVLCQNRLNCAESAAICEQDHTQYTEAFKTAARCTLDQANDGFDCYYTGVGIHTGNETCIPFEWLCDGVYDCPLGNDEEHCDKMTTTRRPASKVPSRCVTDRKFTHVMCQNKCMKIGDVCRDAANRFSCPKQFHMNCKKTQEGEEYDCKCHDHRNRCVTMIDQCDDFEHCEQVCRDSIHYANAKADESGRPSSTTWTILIIVIVLLLLLVVLIAVVRYKRRQNQNKEPSTTSRTPAGTNGEPAATETREKLLKNAATSTANETS